MSLIKYTLLGINLVKKDGAVNSYLNVNVRRKINIS